MNIFDGAELIKAPPRFRGKWITVDPGINLAFALWESKEIKETLYYTNALDRFKAPVPSGAVLIESVELFGGSAVSYASAARGDLFRLAFQIGALIHYFREFGSEVYLVSPRTWKGQLNYKQLRHVLKHKFLYEAKNDHEASAVGLGLWAMGDF